MNTGRHDEGAETIPRTTWRVMAPVFVTLVTCLVAAAILSGLAGVASANEAPTLHSGEKIDDTTVELLFVDDQDMNETTIEADDFLLDNGEIDFIEVTEQGSNATVTIHLKEPINNDRLVIEALPDSGIADENGTELAADFPGVTIENMDGVPPRLLRIEATNATGDTSTIVTEFNEEVAEMELFIGGQTLERFQRADVEKTDDYVYELEYEPRTDGRYFVQVDNATDAAGNSGNPTGRDEFWAFVEGPDAVATIDFTASEGNQFTFDAGGTEGNVTEYTWDFGDGTNATGERVTHEFGPGNYTITLEAVDRYGNVGTDRLGISLPGEREDDETAGNETDGNEPTGETGTVVDVEGNGTVSATVTVTNATATNPVRATAPDSLVASDRYALTGMNVTVTEPGDFEYSVAATSTSVIGDAAQSEDETVVGGFVVTHDLSTVEGAVFEFRLDDGVFDDIEGDPGGVELRREAGEEWESLETTYVEQVDGTHHYETTTDGFSQFAIVAGPGSGEPATSDPGGAAEMTVTNATLNVTTVAPNGTVAVEATVENSGNADGEFVAGLEFDDETVETRTVPVPAAGSETVTFTPTMTDDGTTAVSVNGTDAGTVTVSADNQQSVRPLPEWLELSNVSVEPTEIAPNETVTVTATAENVGDELDGTTLQLRANDSATFSSFVGPINPGQTQPVELTTRLNETGTTTLSINDTEAGTVTVAESGGLFSFLSVLGVLPIGLLRTVLLFVALPVLVLFLGLKGLAYYLGY